MDRVIELDLDGMAHGGEALGLHAGKRIFVPYAIPGERVRAEIIEEKERWARARLLAVLEPSRSRVEPPCPYFGPQGCGGCQWQHIAYERQAELKAEIVADQLRRLGHIPLPPVADIIALADPAGGLLTTGYANHVHFAISAEGKTGLTGASSLEVVPVDRCLLLHEQLDALHQALDVSWPGLEAISLRAGVNTGQALVLFESSGEDPPEVELDLPAACALLTGRGVQPLVGDPWIEEVVGDRRYRVSAESFFPVNTTGAAALVEVVAAYADPRPSDVLLDLYCGVGLFGLALADSVAEVIGVEPSPAACDDFAHNVGERAHAELHEGEVEAVLPALVAQGQRADLALMSPPRSGAGPAVIQQIAALGPRRVVYVSSDPATLARDGVYLAGAGYRLVEAQPVDLMPQTCRVETVALWERVV